MIGNSRHSRTYKVKIADLLGYLKDNREKHLSIVEEAQAEFRRAAICRLDSMLEEAKAGGRIRTSLGLTVPTAHTDAFDNAIGLLELTLAAGESTTEISADEYERFVRNNWEWTQNFLATNGRYSSSLQEG